MTWLKPLFWLVAEKRGYPATVLCYNAFTRKKKYLREKLKKFREFHIDKLAELLLSASTWEHIEI